MGVKKNVETAPEEAKQETGETMDKEKVIKTYTETQTGKTGNSGRVKMVYIGPSLPGAMLKGNTVFDGTGEEIKKSLTEVFEKFPLAEKMLIPVSKLAEMKEKVKTAGNIYNKYYSDLVSASHNTLKKGE